MDCGSPAPLSLAYRHQKTLRGPVGVAESYGVRSKQSCQIAEVECEAAAGGSQWSFRRAGALAQVRAGAQGSRGFVVSLDEMRAQATRRDDQRANGQILHRARDQLRAHLRAKERVVWDATSLRRDFRDKLAELARDYGALVTVVAFQQRESEYAARNRGRSVAVPASVLARQMGHMQWPELDEAHRFLAIDRQHAVLACFGVVGGRLPYGLKAPPQMMTETSDWP